MRWRDRRERTRTERWLKVGAQDALIPRLRRRSLRRIARKPLLDPVGEGDLTKSRVTPLPAVDFRLDLGEVPRSVGLRRERHRRRDVTTGTVWMARLPSA